MTQQKPKKVDQLVPQEAQKNIQQVTEEIINQTVSSNEQNTSQKIMDETIN